MRTLKTGQGISKNTASSLTLAPFIHSRGVLWYLSLLLLLSRFSRVRLCVSPPGSPRPWDSPGKNTGVGCHFLLQCMKVKSESEVAQLRLTLRDPITAAHQAPPSMGLSRQEYWSGVPLPYPISLTNNNKSSFFSCSYFWWTNLHLTFSLLCRYMAFYLHSPTTMYLLIIYHYFLYHSPGISF